MQMNYMEIYNQWLESDYFDAETKKELDAPVINAKAILYQLEFLGK